MQDAFHLASGYLMCGTALEIYRGVPHRVNTPFGGFERGGVMVHTDGAELARRDEMILALMRFVEPPSHHRGDVTPVRRKSSVATLGFAPSRLDGMELRSVLARRFKALGPRERLILFRWYVEGASPAQIALEVGVSRVHCYRLRNRALDQLLSEGAEPLQAITTRSA